MKRNSLSQRERDKIPALQIGRLVCCPRCGTPVREVATKNSFTKHAACTKCQILYVLWGASITRCLTPRSCAGPEWEFVDGTKYQGKAVAAQRDKAGE